MIRSAAIDDLRWMFDLARRCHAPEIAGKDDVALMTWFTAIMLHDQSIVVRGEHTVGIALLSAEPWNPAVRNAELKHLFSEPSGKSAMEPVKVLKEIERQARIVGVSKFFIVSTNADLSPFARRMGAKPVGSCHVVEFAA